MVIISSSLVNLNDKKNEDADDIEEEDNKNVTTSEVKDKELAKKMIYEILIFFNLQKHNQVVIIIIPIKDKEKGRPGRKKKETNSHPPPLVGRGADGNSGGGGTNISVTQLQVTMGELFGSLLLY